MLNKNIAHAKHTLSMHQTKNKIQFLPKWADAYTLRRWEAAMAVWVVSGTAVGRSNWFSFLSDTEPAAAANVKAAVTNQIELLSLVNSNWHVPFCARRCFHSAPNVNLCRCNQLQINSRRRAELCGGQTGEWALVQESPVGPSPPLFSTGLYFTKCCQNSPPALKRYNFSNFWSSNVLKTRHEANFINFRVRQQ